MRRTCATSGWSTRTGSGPSSAELGTYCLSVSQGRFRHMQGKHCCGHEDHGGA
ncbi:unnamed protein product, partial [Pylaiella littoralis]